MVKGVSRVRGLGVLAVAALVLGAAACGGDDDGDAAAPSSTGSAVTAPSTTEGVSAPSSTTSATASSVADGDAGAATKVVDTAMGEVEVPTDPQRIVVLWSATLSSMVRLGFDPIASIGRSGDNSYLEPYLPEGYPIENLEIVSEPREVNFEAVASVEPDLILGGEVPHLVEAYDRLSDIAPTALLTWDGTASWRTMLVDVADVLGVPERAEEVVAEYDAHLAEVRDLVGLDDEPITVSMVRIQSPEELRIETPESFSGQILADVGFDRPDNQLQPDGGADYISLSLERIPEVDAPTIIVTYYFDDFTNDTIQAWEQLQTNGLWQALPAVQAGNVIEADFSYWGSANYYAAHRVLDDIAEAFAS
jgi:iron complex transport system substrate-binding protein